ncbi:hypothetical protein ACHAQA_004301 [Verticillium albo-atrum]
MKSFIAAFGLAGLAFAGPCNNNCGRQVIGTARVSPALVDRKSMCSAFLTSTTTVTPETATVTAAVIYNRNVHGPRDDTPTITGEKPAYASSCVDVTAYWNACQCFEGVAPTTVTVTAATPTATVAGPVCTQGLEFAIYAPKDSAPLVGKLAQTWNGGIANANIAYLIEGLVPDFTGVTPNIGPITGNWQQPLNAPAYGGFVGTPGTQMGRTIIDHRGYINPATVGEYKIVLPYIDDSVFVWAGANALTGFTNSKSVLSRQEHEGSAGDRVYSIQVTDTTTPIPFRLLWINYGGPGGVQAYIYDPSGVQIAGPNAVKNPQVISSCSGAGASVGAWPAWQDETIGA